MLPICATRIDREAGFVFSPNLKFSYDFTKKITGGIGYCGSVGPATDFLPTFHQQHQILSRR